MNLRRSSVFGALALSFVFGAGACAYGSNVPATDELPATSPSSNDAPRASREDSGDTSGDAGTPVTTPTTGEPSTDAGRLESGDDGAIRADSAVAPIDATVGASDGAATTGPARAPTAADLVISEIMFDPSGAEPDGEWLEIANVSSAPIELRGLVLRDGASRSHAVVGSVIVAPGAFAVFARSTVACVAGGVPASAVAYEYGRGLSASAGVILANGATGAIALEYGGVTLTSVAYGTFGIASAGGSLAARALIHEGTPSAASFCAAPPTPGRAPSCP